MEKSHELYMHVKKNIVVKFPPEEKHEMASQFKRAGLSVPLNIVEGCGRYTDKDFAHFQDNSPGSISETDYCCYSASELKYMNQQE